MNARMSCVATSGRNMQRNPVRLADPVSVSAVMEGAWIVESSVRSTLNPSRLVYTNVDNCCKSGSWIAVVWRDKVKSVTVTWILVTIFLKRGENALIRSSRIST